MMGSFLSYCIISGIVLLVLFVTYLLVMSKENQHRYNRVVLLLIYFVSFSVFPFYKWVTDLSFNSSPENPVIRNIEILNDLTNTPHTSIWAVIFIWAFIPGMAVVTGQTIITWFRLLKVIRSGEKIKKGNYTLVITDNERFAPFSWFHFVVIGRSDFESNYSAITTHELKHVTSLHCLDLLIAQLVCIINWFNPAAWLMRDQLMLVHEYQADMAVIESGHDPQEYQMLLIKKAVGARFPSLANSLNHSKLKKRITMMYKEKCSARQKFRALALVPSFAVALALTAVPAVRAAVSSLDSSEIVAGKDNENLSKDQMKAQVFKVTDLNNYDNKTTITIKGENLGDHITVSGGTFTTAGKTYQANSLECQMTDGVATITAVFPFTDLYYDSWLSLTVNGNNIPFNLNSFFGEGLDSNEQALTLPDAFPQDDVVPAVEVYSGDKQIFVSDLSQIDADKIKSVEIDQTRNTVVIKLKK